MKEKDLNALAEILGTMFGGKVEVETIVVPEGKTIKEAVEEHLEAEGAEGAPCPICGEHHDIIRNPDETVEQKQTKAVMAIEGRIGRLTEAIQRLRELQASIAQPYEGRAPTALLKEILLAKEIERLTA